jgi:hypothetical protein
MEDCIQYTLLDEHPDVFEIKGKDKIHSINDCHGYKNLSPSSLCLGYRFPNQESCYNCYMHYTKKCDNSSCDKRCLKKYNYCSSCCPKCKNDYCPMFAKKISHNKYSLYCNYCLNRKK